MEYLNLKWQQVRVKVSKRNLADLPMQCTVWKSKVAITCVGVGHSSWSPHLYLDATEQAYRLISLMPKMLLSVIAQLTVKPVGLIGCDAFIKQNKNFVTVYSFGLYSQHKLMLQLCSPWCWRQWATPFGFKEWRELIRGFEWMIWETNC